MHSVLRHGFAFGNINIIRGKEATREAILQGIEKLQDCKGVIVVYISGHGARWTRGKRDEGILPADIAFKTSSEREWREGGSAAAITGIDLKPILERMMMTSENRTAANDAPAVTLIFDTCHSGSVYRGDVLRHEPTPKTPTLKDGHLDYSHGDLGDGWVPSSKDKFVHLAASSHLLPALELDGRDTDGKPAGAFTLAIEHVVKKLLRSAKKAIDTHNNGSTNTAPMLSGKYNAFVFARSFAENVCPHILLHR